MTWFHRSRWALRPPLVLAVAALFVGSVTAAGVSFGLSTASAQGSSTTYYACLSTKGALSKVGTNAVTCTAPSQEISWNSEGPTGPQGPAGANGTGVSTSSAAPSGSCTSGDTDIALSTDEVWSCKSGAWVNTGANIKGAKGATGATGATGPQGPTGATGPQGPPGPGWLDAFNVDVAQGTESDPIQPSWSDAELVLNCDADQGEVQPYVAVFAYADDSPSGPTLNWNYSSDASGTQAQFVSGQQLPLDALFPFDTRIQGQWIYADSLQTLTINMFAYEDGNGCEFQGTIEGGPLS
jgi:hypothetical protein